MIDRYKELYHYKDIIDFLENNNNILNYNTLAELNENNISGIIEQIP
jgi:hypothetical protein